MPSWPVTLPAPSIDGYRLRPVDRVAGTAFDAGNRRSRRDSDTAPVLVDVMWPFTEAEMADFEYFHAITINGGADAFDIALVNGLESTTCSSTFDDAWQATLLPGRGYQVTATLRTDDLPVMTAAELEVAVAYDLDDIADAASPLHTLVHTTLPGTYWVYS